MVKVKGDTSTFTSGLADAALLDSRKSNWLNPLNMIELTRAVAANKDHVYLQLNRGRTKMLLTYPQRDKVYVTPEEGFVPCGMIARQWIEDYFDIYGT